MGITKIKLKQLENSATVGSIPATDGSNILTYVAPSSGVNHLWGHETGTGTLPVLIGTNLSYDAGTNTLNASAGAGGYSEVQEEGGALTARSKINFIGSGLTAADDGANSRTNVTLNTFLNTLATAGAVTLSGSDVTGTLPVGKGGTGATTLTGLLRGNGTGAITAIGTSSTVGQVLRVTGPDTYAWGALDLADTDAVTGVLDEVNGGTGQSTITTGDILYGSASNTLSKLTIGAASTYLKGGTTPSWATLNIAALSDGGTIATQTYVNNLIAGIRKGSVRVATTANGTLATAFANGQVVDTVTLVTGDLILLKNQSAQAENGAYTVNASGAPTRATWMDAASEIDGVYVAVEDGSQAGTLWITVSDVTTLGTDPIVFTQIQTSGTVLGSAGVTNTLAYWSASNTIDDAALSYTNGSVFALGTVTNAANTILTTKGTDATNTAFGYIHQDSTAAQVFKVSNNGTTTIGISSSNPLVINSSSIVNTGANLTIAALANVLFQSGGSAATGPQATFDATRSLTTGATSNVALTGSFASTSTATNTQLAITSSVTQTGGGTGITRGVHIAPTALTNANDYRGLEITATAAHYALWTTVGKVRFDLGSDATGDTWYRGATGEMVRLAAGATSGHVLTSNGSGAAPSWQAAASTITASNGLTKVTNDIQLGGALTASPTIAGTSTFFLTVNGSRTGASNGSLEVLNSGVSGPGTKSTASGSGAGVWGISSSGAGVYGSSTTGYGIGGYTPSTTAGAALLQVDAANGSNALPILILDRLNSGGAGADGIGSIISFRTETSTTVSQESNTIVSSWTTANHATRQSTLQFTGQDSAATNNLMTLLGTGRMTLNMYGAGTFTGTATKTLQVTSAGIVVEGPVVTATAVTRAYKTSFTGTVITLNSGTDVTDKAGSNIAFSTSGLSADQIFVVKNGVLLSESGTPTRDYTINTGTSVLTLAETAVSDDQFLIYKIV